MYIYMYLVSELASLVSRDSVSVCKKWRMYFCGNER